MATIHEVDFDPFAGSPVDRALTAEGVTGQLADVARSIYQQESSSGKNTKTSNAGARGAMQLIPSTFASVADEGWDINDSEHNARAGVRYLKQLDKQSGGDPALTAAGYYGGPGGLEKARKGIAVSDPRNPGAPNTLQYGQQVAARVPKGAVAQVLDKVTDAVLPSAQAAQPSKNVTLHEVDFDPFAQPAAPAPPKRSMIDELGHQLGLTLRAGVTGAASIPAALSDAVTGPVNAGIDKVAGVGNGFRFQPVSQALNKVMTRAGVAVPENATERVVQDAASAVAGVGGMVKGGLALARYASGPAVRGVGAMLAAGPKTQLITAATGAGASGATREAGGGAGAQLAAGLIGSGAPIGLAYTRRQPNGNKQIAAAALKANEAGYVIPPADLNPGMMTEAASGLSGKIKTAQTASQRNQIVTNNLARKALGMSAADDLTIESLEVIRKNAGQAYQAVAGTGIVTPSANYAAALDDAIKPFLSQAKSFPDRKMPALVENIQALKTGQFDAADAVETIKVIRSEADAAYRAGDALGGKAFKQAARAMEDAIDEHLVKTNAPADILKGYREARQLIAKTYTVEKALNSQTGNVNSQTLAGNLTKGKPLSGDLKTIAEIGQAFPKATQALKESPKQFSPLDFAVAVGAAGSSMDPTMLAGVVARPAVRHALLSKYAQQSAVKSAGAVNTGIMPGIPAAAVGAATRVNDVTPPPEAYLHEVDFDPFALPAPSADPAQPAPEPPVRIELNGMAKPDGGQPVEDPVQEIDGQGAPTVTETPQGSVEIDPAHAFTSEPRPDGALAIKGNPQALHGALVAAGIPAHSIIQNKTGVMVGRMQAAQVQQAIDRLHATAAAPKMTPAAAPSDAQPEPMADAALYQGQGIPQELASNQDTAPEEYTQSAMNSGVESQPADAVTSVDSRGMPQDMKTAQTGDSPSQAEAPAIVMSESMQSTPVDRIQRLRDSGEHKVADLLQRSQDRNKTMGDVQTELASMQAGRPDLPHHGSPTFNDHYQQQRLAGSKPAEASAHAGMLHAVQLAAPQIGMPEAAVKALTAKLQDIPIDEAPAFVERFTKALIGNGMIRPFEGSNHVASALEHARDAAMHGALDSLYQDNSTSA